ncbi:MAG: flagellar export protein FliJ [Lachnospiraceae bacterium]|nr:flagellar export protein FliJ [Lachnospiraceae bacterium]
MAKFVFSMENLLQIKSKLEDQAKAEYGIQMAILRQEEQRLAELEQRKLSMQEQLKEQISNVLDLFRIRQLEDGVENIKYNMNLQKVVIANQQKKVESARMKLDEAMKERKTYEKLKEKAFEVFRQELNAAEQKEADELVSFRFGNTEERED